MIALALTALLLGQAAAPPARDRFSAVVTVKDYGAQGNGSHDDTAAIQAAINVAQAVNGTVFFPPGDYPFSSTLVISARVTLQGSGMGEESGAAVKAGTLLRKTAAVDGIRIASGVTHATIEDLGLYSAVGTGSDNGIVIGDVDATNGAGHNLLRNVWVKGQRGNGVLVRNGNGNRLDRVTASANFGHGISLDSQNTGSSNVNANVLTGLTALSNAGDGIHIGTSVSNSVVGFDSEGNAGWGLYLGAAYNFVNGYVESNAAGPLYVGVSAFDCLVALRSVSGSVSLNNGNNWVYLQDGSGKSPILRPNEGTMILRGGMAVARVTPTYGASVAIDASLGNEFVVTAANGTAFTVASPSSANFAGQRITIRIRNTTGGALGALTWGAAFKLASWTQPAPGFSRAIDFQFDGTNWVETGRTTSDVPN